MNTTDSFCFNLCLEQIESKLGLPPGEEWKHRDFQYISDAIGKETGIILSVSTLKRLWKQDTDRMPQTTTLNALASFLGFDGWNEFKLKCAEAESPISETGRDHRSEISTGFNLITRNISALLRKKAVRYTAPVAVVLSVFSLAYIQPFTSDLNQPLDELDSVTFSSRKVVTAGVPNTVIFDYDISAVKSEDVYIQQSWNDRQRELISKENRHHTSVYYYPGFHRAKLLVGEDIIRRHNIHITTDGWLTVARKELSDTVPVYLPEDDVESDGRLYVSPAKLRENKLDTGDNNFWVSYYNVQDFGQISGSDFKLNTTVRNNLDNGGLTGQYVGITVMCENGRMVISLAHPGCVGNIYLKFMEVMKFGRDNDLSPFGMDLNEWTAFTWEVAGKNVKISTGEKIVYEDQFVDDPGRIIGLHFWFYGSGEVGSVSLKNAEGIKIFEEDFTG